MKLLLIILLIFVLNINALSISTPASSKIFVGDTLFNDIEELIDPFIGPLLMNIKIPNMNVFNTSSFSVNLTNIKVSNYKMNGLGMKSLDNNNDGQVLWIFSIDNFQITTDMNYKVWGDISNATGAGNVTVYGGNIDIIFSLSGNNGKLNFTCLKGTSSIKSYNAEFDGPDAGQIKIALEIMWPTLMKDLNTILSDIPPLLNPYLLMIFGNIPTSIQLFDFGRLYFGLTSNVLKPLKATSEFTEFDLALELDPLNSDIDPFKHHTLPSKPIQQNNSATPMLGLTIDEFVLNSAFFTLQDSGYMIWNRQHNNAIFNTTALKAQMPDLYTAYPDAIWYTNLTIDKYPQVNMYNGNIIGLSLPISTNTSMLMPNNSMIEHVFDLKLIINVNVTTKLIPLNTGATNLSINLVGIHFNITTLKSESKFDFDSSKWMTFLNALIGGVLPVINSSIPKLTLPSIISDFMLNVSENYLEVSLCIKLFNEIVSKMLSTSLTIDQISTLHITTAKWIHMYIQNAINNV